MTTEEHSHRKRLMKLKFTDSGKMYSYMLFTFFVLLIIDTIAYVGLFSLIPNFLVKYGWWMLYLDISIATLGGAVWYYATHKGYVSCMASMMIAMTVGMQTGMMLGAVFGAVNGYFIGAMVGMIIGSIFGIVTGRDSIMGWLQGLMMGIMGGTMGAMITMMMYTDHVLWFMPFYMILNVAVLIGFAYMYYDEVVKDNNELRIKEIDLTTFTSLCVILGIVLTTLLVYAPKSILFGG